MIDTGARPKYTQCLNAMEDMTVPLSAKHFSERLNSCLDDTGAPAQERERAMILSKLIDIPKQQAWALLEGHQLPDQPLLEKLASEFEVDPQWLTGEK